MSTGSARALIDQLAAHRTKAGLSQSEVARRIGISPSAISMLESNPKRMPLLDTVIRYATAIGTTLTIKENP
jgi:HTH-type transcriptional regulator/antitoxin HipB